MSSRLILGDGLLGSELHKQTGWDYVSRKKDGIDFVEIDSYKDYLFEYDEIINCIAHTDTYSDERDEHWDVNYKGVVDLVDWCNMADKKLVQIITDYIYANSEVGVDEDGVPVHCGNWYGYTKLLGDAYVQLKSDNHLLIRSTHKPKPFKYEKAWVNQIGNFDYVTEISKLIVKLVNGNSYGIFNVGTEVKTMYDLAKRTNYDVVPEYKLSDKTTPTNLIMDISKMERELNE
jgi:dTDP-4-dehydrorhamnose reductase|tara:strand:- start:2408 stop:3103 length:696 start_codon:yes stop_codon:yes gene_type:complete